MIARPGPVRIAALVVAALITVPLATVDPISAQGPVRVERVGAGDAAFDRRLDRLIASDDYLLVTADTTIDAGDVVPRTVFVLDATLRLAGRVRGDLVSVDGNVFLRPTGRVEGDAVNIGGGLYRTAEAEVRGRVYDRPDEAYRVERTAAGFRVVSAREESRLDLPGFFGFRQPWYDRVDGLWVRWGAEYRLATVAGADASLLGDVGYRTELDRGTGGAALQVERGRGTATVGVARRTATNEEWIRSALRSGLSFAYDGDDYRDYYEVEELFAGLRWVGGVASRRLGVRVRGQIEDASSLAVGDPFALLEGPPYRPNPPIDDGTITSILAGLDGAWVGRVSAVEGEVGVELAANALGGDFSFGRFVVQGEWAMEALADHILEVEWFGQGPLPGTGTLPRQRWTFVGGSGTLNTFEIGTFRGDRVVFVGTDYVIPLPEVVRIPILGSPDLELLHRVGMAWTEDTDRDLAQNIGARLQFFAVYIRALTEPADALDAFELDIGLSWPFDDDRPWRGGTGL